MPRPVFVRTGPRPLPLHLLTAALTWFAGAAGAGASLRAGGSPLPAEGASLAAEIARVDPVAFAAAVRRQADERFTALLAAVDGYQRHPARRTAAEPPPIWAEGTTRLLDYGGPSGAPAVLVIPSLVNRYYILDLAQEVSFAATLRAAGMRPLIVDWGFPGDTERSLDVGGYVDRLTRALNAATSVAGAPVGLLGYCMGGLLAMALASGRPDSVAALALLATPWDFHADRPELARMIASAVPLLDPLLDRAGEASVELLQTLFYALDPLNVVRKFLSFGALQPDDPRATAFVLLEDWLNDGVPVAAPVLRECLTGWYGENRPARGCWAVAGEPVDPAGLRPPALVVVPNRDRIVPPVSAMALAEAIPGAQRMQPATGHIGMVAGRRSREDVARPVAAWLLAHARPARRRRPRL